MRHLSLPVSLCSGCPPNDPVAFKGTCCEPMDGRTRGGGSPEPGHTVRGPVLLIKAATTTLPPPGKELAPTRRGGVNNKLKHLQSNPDGCTFAFLKCGMNAMNAKNPSYHKYWPDGSYYHKVCLEHLVDFLHLENSIWNMLPKITTIAVSSYLYFLYLCHFIFIFFFPAAPLTLPESFCSLCLFPYEVTWLVHLQI